MTHLRRLLLLLFFVAAALAVVPVGLAAAADPPAYVRLAHLSPDTPSVDVYVDSIADRSRSFEVPGVGYGTLSGYRALPAGTYVVSMRPAGAPASTAPVISTTVDARPGSAYTIAGVGPAATLGLAVLPDRLDIPAGGRATVRVINAAPALASADIGPIGGPPWASDVRFGATTGYADVPLGTWTCDVVADGRSVAQLPVDLRGNSVYTVLLLDRGNGLTAELHTDSTGAAVVPVGGVETGFGGTALDGPAPDGPAFGGPGIAAGPGLVLLGCALLAATAGLARRARRR